MANDLNGVAPPDPLVSTAGLIADGDPVEWAALAAMVDDGVVTELAVLERIANAHRKLHTLLPDARSLESGARWGHLELLEEVGRGSYGLVYRAIDTHLHREVALKLYTDAAPSLTAIDEGRHLAAIDHRNVVRVFGADVIDGRGGIWMEFIRGQRLDRLVAEGGPLSAREAAGIGDDIARALAAIHAAGLVHRDVKAQNVMRAAGGRLVLMDLGASGATEGPSGGLAGTPLYMAPELFEGARPTPASDIYSLGVLLFFLVTGSFPVAGRTIDDIRRCHHARRQRRLTDLRPDLPAAFVRVVTTALHDVPQRRHETAGHLADALAALAAAPPVPKPSLRGMLAVGAAVMVTALLVLVAVLNHGRRDSQVDGPASLAVLPIRNLTGDPAKAYVADGLTEVITAGLGRLPALRVPSSAATAQFRDSREPLPDLARKLGVKLLLAGAVTQADTRIRLSVQLVEPTSGRVLWGQEIVRTPATILSAQSEIAQTITARLALAAPGDGAPAPQASTSAAAQDAYLRGLVEVNTQLESRALKGVEYFQQAVRDDPLFAAAWAELALAELRGIEAGDWRARVVRAEEAREHALKAIALDPRQPMGYVALASVQYNHDWDFASADATFRDALDIAPSNAFARMRYAYLLAARNRLDEALDQARQARDLEPLVPVRSTAVGIFRYYLRDFPGALAEMQRALDLSPGLTAGHYGMGRVLIAMGKPREGAEQIRLAIGSSVNPGYLGGLAYAYAMAGQHDLLAQTLERLDDLERAGRHASIDHRAYVAIAERRFDDAFRILHEALDRRMTNVLWIAVDPRVDPIRDDPRFAALLAKLELKR